MASDSQAYLNQVGDAHRKRYGQFFTNPQVASFMVNWVLSGGRKALHDPAFGLGAFHIAAERQEGVAFTGGEVDSKILEHWRRHSPESTAEVLREDYLWSWGRSHSNIVCNPPYIRFQHFRKRDQVLAEIKRRTGLRLSGYTNAASTFLVKSLFDLDQGGRLAYIMPLEFLNAGYGEVIKKRLVTEGHLAAIVKLSCEKEAFPDATTSVGIVLYDSSVVRSHVDFFDAQSIEELPGLLKGCAVSKVPPRDLDPAAKWLPFLRRKTVKPHRQNMVPIEYYGRFKRGIATGANEFFALRPSRARELGVSAVDLRKCVTRSAQVRRPVFTGETFAALMSDDESTYLFSPAPSPSPEALQYIRFGESKRFHKRFLTSKRSPWYKAEARSPSPIWVGVFSRGGYKVIRNRADVLNLTCFHGFQPNLFGNLYTDRLFLYLLSDSGREIVSLSIREYGDTLDKFEPNDLNAALAPEPSWFDAISEADVAESMAQVEATGVLPDGINARFAALTQPTSGSRSLASAGGPAGSRKPLSESGRPAA